MMLNLYISNLGKYVEGFLVGEWVELPVPTEELDEVLKRIGINEKYEEFFLTDWESEIYGLTKVIGEYTNIYKLNELAEMIEALDSYDIKKLEAVLEYQGATSATEVMELIEDLDSYTLYENIENDYDLGYYFAEDCCCIDIPENLKCYFDYSSYGRDIDLDGCGCFTKNGYIMAY